MSRAIHVVLLLNVFLGVAASEVSNFGIGRASWAPNDGVEREVLIDEIVTKNKKKETNGMPIHSPSSITIYILTQCDARALLFWNFAKFVDANSANMPNAKMARNEGSACDTNII